MKHLKRKGSIIISCLLSLSITGCIAGAGRDTRSIRVELEQWPRIDTGYFRKEMGGTMLPSSDCVLCKFDAVFSIRLEESFIHEGLGLEYKNNILKVDGKGFKIAQRYPKAFYLHPMDLGYANNEGCASLVTYSRSRATTRTVIVNIFNMPGSLVYSENFDKKTFVSVENVESGFEIRTTKYVMKLIRREPC